MGKALDIIDKLKVISFDWKETNEHDIGMIAEEVEKIIPEAVWKEKDIVMGLKPLTLIAVLIKAIQELRGET
jgi:hypothetical protein